MTARPVVDVAVGVLIRPDGRFLLASRPEGKPYAHYWEFPGGKLEPGETVAAALARELHEELGVDISRREPLGRAGIRIPARSREAALLPRYQLAGRTARPRGAGVPLLRARRSAGGSVAAGHRAGTALA